ncbi:MAG: hypothetical protein C4297_09805 [Gemmataceae bacterium]
MQNHTRRLILFGTVLTVAWGFFFGVPCPATACPFCSMQGQTLSMEVQQAALVVFGTLANPRLNAAGDGLDAGTTDLIIEEVVKPHDFIKDKKTIVLPRYIPVEKNSKVKFLIFCDVFQGRLDPYRGIPVKTKDIVGYLRGANTIRTQPAAQRLAFFFQYLDHEDVEISTDAYKEFANASYDDVGRMVAQGERDKIADRVRKWLADPQTPPYRFGLYGLILGMCGREKDAAALLELLDDPQRGLVSGIDGVLAGYVMLKPKEGWSYLRALLADGQKEFVRRYAGLRTVRFLWENHPEIVDQKTLLEGLKPLLDQPDIADLAIEDLRKWRQWQVADRIIDLAGRESHNVPIIQRAIIRFALSCPPSIERAAAFVKEQRARDPDRVKDIEELLKLEAPVQKGGS